MHEERVYYTPRYQQKQRKIESRMCILVFQALLFAALSVEHVPPLGQSPHCGYAPPPGSNDRLYNSPYLVKEATGCPGTPITLHPQDGAASTEEPVGEAEPCLYSATIRVLHACVEARYAPTLATVRLRAEIPPSKITLYTSLTPVCAPPPAPAPLPACAGAAPLRFKLPILCTRLLPTASTAPLGASKLGVCASPCCTLNSLMLVLFHTPAVPLATTISDANTKPQSSDSYQPRESVDHSKRCTRMGDGSMPGTVVDLMVWRAAAVSSLDSSLGERVWISINVVCRGSSLSQDSSCGMLA